MNVIIISESYPFGLGTEESFVQPEIEAAIKEGHNVILLPIVDRGPLAASFPPEATVSRILCDSPFIRRRWLRPFLLPAALIRLGRNAMSRYALASEAVRQQLSSFLHKNRMTANDTRIIAFWFDFPSGALPGLGIPYAVRAHGYDLHIHSSTAIREATLTGACAVMPVSRYGADLLTEKFPNAAHLISVSPLGTRICDHREQVAPTGSVSFISIARVVELKRVHLALDLIAALAIARPGWKFSWTHIGGGPLLEPLRRRVAEAMEGLPTLSVTLTGELPHSEAMRMLDSGNYNFGIHTSAAEGGQPLAITEMMARGIPVAAADCGGVSEVIDDDSGILLPADPDPDLFITGLLPFLDNTRRYQCLSRAARERVGESFDAEVLRRQAIRLLTR